jgi:hypothetical protein
MQFRDAKPEDQGLILQVHRLAFGRDDEADLVAALLHDGSAQPVRSVVAEAPDGIVGHALFTAVRLAGAAALMLTHGLIEITFGLWLMNRVCFPGENLSWYWRVLGVPMLVSAPVVALSKCRGRVSAATATRAATMTTHSAVMNFWKVLILSVLLLR